jgi:ComF family protein
MELRRLGQGFLDLLYPPVCLTCDELDGPFCPACRAAIVPTADGADLPRVLEAVRSGGYHEGPLRKAVLRLKFGGKIGLAPPLGELLWSELEPRLPEWRPDALVPVPIHWTRLLERGFNQSQLLAEQVSRRSGVPLRKMLRRVRRTPPQIGLEAAERAHNLQGALAPAPSFAPKGLRLVVIDDVRTTGSTLAACAAVLRAGGAAEVYGLTVTYDL